ncbi:hypothetical protein FVEG_15926 [Fusarium verticillioides 7600]|uniref:Uncharacterized protein n=1 Tax=Gibberella moniliformis (strain M3125 / FGSC 7600) TaxID=334819 RepID=W7MN76_GIBM7|nr:hypothetical protein FVEG_15926 [Fusarium verticillioides 7600]EWG46122.1 hypothetical protein FVEG_15926 [Fusarium verticillioides 7600]
MSHVAQMLLEHGAEYKYVNRLGDDALYLAAQAGKVSVVKRLLRFGNWFGKRRSSGPTPLHVASNTDVVRILLVAGFNANAIDDNGWTPLHNLARQGNTDGIELLLRYGANVHALTKDGRTALHLALEAGENFDWDILRIVLFLLDNGADESVKDSNGLTPLHAACLPYTPNVLGPSPRKEATSLHSVYLPYGVKVVGLLIDKGADVNALDNEGVSPFQMAVQREIRQANVDIISLLVKQGANVNSQDNNGFTALHQFDCSVDTADLLLNHGVIIDARDAGGKTALFRSFERGDLYLANFLIERGADVKAVTNCEKTMLHAMNNKDLSLCQSNFYSNRQRFSEKRGVEQMMKLLCENGGKNVIIREKSQIFSHLVHIPASLHPQSRFASQGWVTLQLASTNPADHSSKRINPSSKRTATLHREENPHLTTVQIVTVTQPHSDKHY